MVGSYSRGDLGGIVELLGADAIRGGPCCLEGLDPGLTPGALSCFATCRSRFARNFYSLALTTQTLSAQEFGAANNREEQQRWVPNKFHREPGAHGENSQYTDRFQAEQALDRPFHSESGRAEQHPPGPQTGRQERDKPPKRSAEKNFQIGVENARSARSRAGVEPGECNEAPARVACAPALQSPRATIPLSGNLIETNRRLRGALQAPWAHAEVSLLLFAVMRSATAERPMIQSSL